MTTKKKIIIHTAAFLVLIVGIIVPDLYKSYPKYEMADYQVVIPANPAVNWEVYTLKEGKCFYLMMSDLHGNQIEGYYLYLDMSKEEYERISDHMYEYTPDRILADGINPRIIYKGNNYAYMQINDHPHPLNALKADITKENGNINILVKGAEIVQYPGEDWTKKIMIYNQQLSLIKTQN
ncbi:MAG: hypothetical protein ABFD91_14600 [Anaerohalosphaeraceae bacterium]